jgi:hypothetical protein
MTNHQLAILIGQIFLIAYAATEKKVLFVGFILWWLTSFIIM